MLGNEGGPLRGVTCCSSWWAWLEGGGGGGGGGDDEFSCVVMGSAKMKDYFMLFAAFQCTVSHPMVYHLFRIPLPWQLLALSLPHYKHPKLDGIWLMEGEKTVIIKERARLNK